MPNRAANLLAAAGCLLLIAAVYIPAAAWRDADDTGRIVAVVAGVGLGVVGAICAVGSVVVRRMRR
jgi:hypothetical protein